MVHSSTLQRIIHNVELYLFLPTATLSIQLGRISFNEDGVPNPVEIFDVEGVASVQVGGGPSLTYYIECSCPEVNCTEGLTWSRESGQINPLFTQDNEIPSALRLRMAGALYTDLDVYVCTDTNTGEVVRLNVTTGECQVIIPTESVSVLFSHCH